MKISMIIIKNNFFINVIKEKDGNDNDYDIKKNFFIMATKEKDRNEHGYDLKNNFFLI